MTGELDSHRKRLSEEEAKCTKGFECGIEELPALIEGFKSEAETSLARAEVTLGLREEEFAPAEKQEPAPVPVSAVKKVRMPATMAARVTTQKMAQDEDGI